MSNAQQVLIVGAIDCNDQVNTFMVSWSLGKPARVADEYGGLGIDIARVGVVDMSGLVESRFVVEVKGASVDAVTSTVAAISAELAALSPITIGLKNSAHVGTLIPKIAECIELAQEPPWDSRLVNANSTLIEIVVRRNPYVSWAAQTVIGSALPLAPVGSNWATDYLSSTYGAGDAVVALRFDDGRSEDWSLTLPRLEARGLHGGFAIVTCLVDHSSAYLSLANLQRIQSGGHEIMCHSYTHAAGGAPYAEFYHETVDAKAALEALGLTIASFVEPGEWGDSAWDIDATNWTMGSNLDLLLRANFDAYEGYCRSMFLTLPVASENRYGAQHYSPDCYSAGGAVIAKEKIDYAIAHGDGVELLFHSVTIGAAGISVADFESTLDYLATKQAAGDLTVLTPTQYLYAVQS